MPGVVRTRVGYTGGTQKDPTYRSMGDHTESIEIEFDPEKLSYEDLLDVFWMSHNPCHQAGSRQYMSALFYHDKAQLEAINDSKKKEEEKRGKIHTHIVKAEKFYDAEDYHQKYRLRGTDVYMNEMNEIYPKASDFHRSTAAARINGYLAGFRSASEIEREIPKLGLSDAVATELLTRVNSGRRR